MLDSPVAWAATAVCLATLAIVGLTVSRHDGYPGRKPLAPVLLSIGLAVLVSVMIWLLDSPADSISFIADYFIELVFAIETGLVFILAMNRWAPVGAHTRVATIGVIGTFCIRTLLIVVIGNALASYLWLLFIPGIAVLFIAMRSVRHSNSNDLEPLSSKLIRRIAEKAQWVRHGAILPPTVLASIVLTFADPLAWPDGGPLFSVIIANALALLPIPFAIGLVKRVYFKIKYADYMFAILGGFVGIRLVSTALRSNALPFINKGQAISWAPSLPGWFILGYALTIVVVAVVMSLIFTRGDRRKLLADRETKGE